MNISKIYQQSYIWFVTGSQHLYGEEIFSRIKDHSQKICRTLNDSAHVPVQIKFKALLTQNEDIKRCMAQANADDNCAGIIFWMHTFSPAKMWIQGLQWVKKPLLHFHTQFNRDIPFASIDMDFMNLNQSAHGGREFGFINACLGINREIVVGHYQEPTVMQKVGSWARVAIAWNEAQTMQLARFGDNMRQVAVTEGNKVSAQIQFGYSVHGYGVGDLVESIRAISDSEAQKLAAEYNDIYEVETDLQKKGPFHADLIDAAKQELGMQRFLEAGNFCGFTTTFEDLHGLNQLPGFACQRLMVKGYGFGAEGDWKTAALLHTAKVIASGNDQGTSFMEDYTYHLDPANSMVLGAHMLEICPTLAAQKPKIERHKLGIGGKNPPVRLVFNTAPGPAVNATLIDLGNRFRLILNEVEAVAPKALPKLPVARVLLKPKPDLASAAGAWILAGGAHHTVFTKSVTSEQFAMLARLAGIEMINIDAASTLDSIRNELRWNELYYGMKNCIR